MSNNYKVEVTFLSPVHVGTGQEMEPFDYVIKEDEDKIPFLYLIDLMNWMAFSENGKKVAGKMNFDSAGEVRKTIYTSFDPLKDKDYIKTSIQVADQDFYNKYKNNINSGSLNNQLIVNLLNRSSVNSKPFIPGSSIKGSIRTAFLEKYRKGQSPRDERDYNNFIFDIAGKPQASPFKLLKTGDLILNNVQTWIMEAKEISNNVNKTATPKNYYEITDGLTFSMDEINFYKEKMQVTIETNIEKIKKCSPVIPINLEEILKTTREYYKPRLLAEYNKFFKKPAGKNYDKIVDTAETLLNNETVIRVGRYSHVEFITFDLDICRNAIKTPTKNGNRMPFGTTRTVQMDTFNAGKRVKNMYSPFGWIKLAFN